MDKVALEGEEQRMGENSTVMTIKREYVEGLENTIKKLEEINESLREQISRHERDDEILKKALNDANRAAEQDGLDGMSGIDIAKRIIDVESRDECQRYVSLKIREIANYLSNYSDISDRIIELEEQRKAD